MRNGLGRKRRREKASKKGKQRWERDQGGT